MEEEDVTRNVAKTKNSLRETGFKDPVVLDSSQALLLLYPARILHQPTVLRKLYHRLIL